MPDVLWLCEQTTHAVEYQGELDPVALGRAFVVSCRRHPILRSRITRSGSGFRLEIAPNWWPTIHVRPDGRLPGLPGPEFGVAGLSVICGAGGGLVALQTYLSAGAGQNWAAFFFELWQLYADFVSARDVPERAAMDALPLVPPKLPTEVRMPAPPGPEGFFRVERVLGPHTTASLHAVARRRKSSVDAVLCDAVLRAHLGHAPEIFDVSTVDLGGAGTVCDLDVVTAPGHGPLRAPADNAWLAHLPMALGGVSPENVSVVCWSRIGALSRESPWHGFVSRDGSLRIVSVYPRSLYNRTSAESVTDRVRGFFHDWNRSQVREADERLRVPDGAVRAG